jgi:hypothetical protein
MLDDFRLGAFYQTGRLSRRFAAPGQPRRPSNSRRNAAADVNDDVGCGDEDQQQRPASIGPDIARQEFERIENEGLLPL